jgi:hypothetical protein
MVCLWINELLQPNVNQSSARRRALVWRVAELQEQDHARNLERSVGIRRSLEVGRPFIKLFIEARDINIAFVAVV